MRAHIDDYLTFADACRSRAEHEYFPPWREKLLALAGLSDREATLVERSRECIDESKELIAHADVLLSRWPLIYGGGAKQRAGNYRG